VEGVFFLDKYWDEITAKLCENCPLMGTKYFGGEAETNCEHDMVPEIEYDGGVDLRCKYRFE
jgi:hypothetical protein